MFIQGDKIQKDILNLRGDWLMTIFITHIKIFKSALAACKSWIPTNFRYLKVQIRENMNALKNDAYIQNAFQKREKK